MSFYYINVGYKIKVKNVKIWMILTINEKINN